ncbi:MAG TPA: phage virion morphogenesis protein [Candidatus Angelobacter sp.]|nr:phage virion morphogenesis protein [Candidatus Angelobacter sp.]
MATVSIRITRDDIRPAFARAKKLGRDTTPIMRAMGDTFKSITEGNFSAAGASYRPIPWVNKKDGTPRTLKKSGLLWHSFHLTVTKDTATLANPTPYAAVQQFGSGDVDRRRQAEAAKRSAAKVHKMNIPASPFYPVKDGKLTPAAEEKIGAAGMRTAEKIIGG